MSKSPAPPSLDSTLLLLKPHLATQSEDIWAEQTQGSSGVTGSRNMPEHPNTQFGPLPTKRKNEDLVLQVKKRKLEDATVATSGLPPPDFSFPYLLLRVNGCKNEDSVVFPPPCSNHNYNVRFYDGEVEKESTLSVAKHAWEDSLLRPSKSSNDCYVYDYADLAVWQLKTPIAIAFPGPKGDSDLRTYLGTHLQNQPLEEVAKLFDVSRPLTEIPRDKKTISILVVHVMREDAETPPSTVTSASREEKLMTYKLQGPYLTAIFFLLFRLATTTLLCAASSICQVERELQTHFADFEDVELRSNPAATQSQAPSYSSQPRQHGNLQGTNAAVSDGRIPPGSQIPTIGLSAGLFEPAFTQFSVDRDNKIEEARKIRDQGGAFEGAFDRKLLVQVMELCRELANIRAGEESERYRKLEGILTELLGVTVVAQARSGEGARLDFACLHTVHGSLKVPFLVVEIKAEMATINDPLMQDIRGYLSFLRAVKDWYPVTKTNAPAFVLSIHGCTITVGGVALPANAQYQHLAPGLRCVYGVHITSEFDTVVPLAATFHALAKGVASVEKMYDKVRLELSSSGTLRASDISGLGKYRRSRFFPWINCFGYRGEGQSGALGWIPFRWLAPLKSTAACSTFLIETISSATAILPAPLSHVTLRRDTDYTEIPIPHRLVLKFVRRNRYGYEAHRHMAMNHNLAPKLFSYERFDIEGYELFSIVVMEWVGEEHKQALDPSSKFRPIALKSARQNMEKAVRILHHEGFVHGDLRSENVLVHEKCGSILLVDFDFATRIGNSCNCDRLGNCVCSDNKSCICKEGACENLNQHLLPGDPPLYPVDVNPIVLKKSGAAKDGHRLTYARDDALLANAVQEWCDRAASPARRLDDP
ncbi:hypothetical protein V5O48_016723 [Marasmius crinis-equi]|uniref:Protein kinase domain-containing protein n=1 Tax=Marasmius crinis-equi TaxID=585013 RepID=A0ABR3EQX3_9AGAR